ASLIVVLLPAPSGAQEDEAAHAKRDRLLEIYTRAAEEYTIYRDSRRAEKLELQRKPVYHWLNPLRAGGQDGGVFVWTCRGRAEAIGTFFSFPTNGPRELVHEMHSLAITVLDVTRSGDAGRPTPSWAPRAAGVNLAPIPDAPTPAASPAQRLIQMRAL